ncbi:carboxymuconolactone decarboxylase family protein [Mycobacterium camsae]|uniref:carboxymuconolactone decarboxylase family protein n=1 Tax=Mycobacterium gordonae TaxID=1778 RepID=UPI0019814860|nr:carboxymuconolactone decarboxylase family protein [Mycobacterium gordonae]
MPLPADQLTRLVAFSDGRLSGLVRRVCAQTMSLPPLPNPVVVGEPESEAEAVVAEFAEQFSADVSAITVEQRSRIFKYLGNSTFRVVVAMFIADFVPRVRAGFEALGVGSEYLGWLDGSLTWDDARDPSDELFSRFLPRVGRERAVDPVTSELVRLRGATAHNCRLCRSLREGNALDAGGSESLYDEIAQFENSVVLDDRAKAALRYADALIWTPAHLAVDDAAEVRSRFSPDEAVELTFDIMRNASNKIAVSLGADAPRVESGTERYLIDVDGQTVFS